MPNKYTDKIGGSFYLTPIVILVFVSVNHIGSFFQSEYCCLEKIV